MDDMQELTGLEVAEIARLLGGPSYRAQQIFEWIYGRGVRDFNAMTSLPADLRNHLAGHYTITLPETVQAEVSRDGTTKYALRVGDEVIEAVHMPDEKRDTLCISSQAGCSFGCAFCVTARMNLRRHLTAGEIAGQVLLTVQNHGRPRPLNIVFMGMGEPLHNYDSVMKAFRILSHPRGLAISSRRITISTVGLVPAIERLGAEEVIPQLAVSLNAPDNDLRSRIMPVNRLYPIEKLMDALAGLPIRHRRRITFEYVLLRDVNDSPAQARSLLEVTRGIRCKINLIPFNSDAHINFARPDEEAISRFARVLAEAGRTVAVRRSRGPDISAACGQLGTHYIDPQRVPLTLQ